MKRTSVFAIITTVLVLSACEKISEPNQSDLEQSNEGSMLAYYGGDEDSIILGEKLDNPFLLENMEDSLGLPAGTLTPTHHYVRLRPKSEEDYEQLIADSLELWHYPLDYEILKYGSYYMDPDVRPDEAPWVYTVVKPEYQSPKIEMELLAKIYLPDEGLGKATARKKPAGYVNVFDNELATNRPVRKVKVKARQWFWWSTTYTNNDGYFRVNRNFNSRWGRVTISTIYENNYIELRDLDWNWSLSNLWNILFGSYYVHGRWTVNNDITNININLANNTKRAKWATVLNATAEYRDYCVNYGISLPNKLRVYTLPGWAGGFTPMLHRMASDCTDLLAIFAALSIVDPSSAVASFLVEYFAPDITIGIGPSGTMVTAQTKETMYHELGHASHYTEVGNAFWTTLGAAMLAAATGPGNGAYGDGSAVGAERVALAESWGFFMGFKLIIDRYGCTSTDMYGTDKNYCDQMEDGMFNTPDYIPFGVYHDLIDTYNSDELFDNVSGYNIGQFFNILSNQNNYTPIRFKNSFKSAYVSAAAQSLVDDLFNEYGY